MKKCMVTKIASTKGLRVGGGTCWLQQFCAEREDQCWCRQGCRSDRVVWAKELRNLRPACHDRGVVFILWLLWSYVTCNESIGSVGRWQAHYIGYKVITLGPMYATKCCVVQEPSPAGNQTLGGGGRSYFPNVGYSYACNQIMCRTFFPIFTQLGSTQPQPQGGKKGTGYQTCPIYIAHSQRYSCSLMWFPWSDGPPPGFARFL